MKIKVLLYMNCVNMNHVQQKCKQKHHHPPDYPGGLEDIAQRNTAFGKRLMEEFRKLKERRHD